MFGPRFLRDYGDRAPDVWAKAILGLKDRELQKGLSRLLKGGSGSVPTLPQFVKLCRTIGDDEGPAPQHTALPPPSYHPIHAHAQQVMLSFLRHKGAASTEAMRAMVVEKNRLVGAYQDICRDEPEASVEIRDKLWEAFGKVWKPIESLEMQRHAQSFERTHFASDFQR